MRRPLQYSRRAANVEPCIDGDDVRRSDEFADNLGNGQAHEFADEFPHGYPDDDGDAGTNECPDPHADAYRYTDADSRRYADPEADGVAYA
ncbi:MAG TPA: hypothetical protein VME66_14310 [Candidatus Acidoferrales bacterium]|nr:hypothetical protein [Candidatus Acidoferrales bacterium]